ncbi:MAG: hypothetical protein LBJ95_03515 [Oscillospiraceae bacterium]|jgi:hypothetical protein|nr:hypothetical protein [Oscillospiraceae bacterium]
MQPFNCFRKLICLALASTIASPFAVNAVPYHVSAQLLGIKNDPHHQNIIDEDGNVSFTFKLQVYKHQTYPVGCSMSVVPYVGSLDDYVNADNGSSALCNIIKLNPQFHLPEDTSAEIEARYLGLNGIEIPEESLGPFEAIGIPFITAQNRCIAFEKGTLTGLSIDECSQMYDHKCQLEDAANNHFRTLVEAFLPDA